jgi:hypothetical protein
MFSKRGEKQFASHRTKAEEHSAKIFMHLMGKKNLFIQRDLRKRRKSGEGADHISGGCCGDKE